MAALHDRLLSAPRVGAVFAAEAQLRAMLDVESALAAAAAGQGLIPGPAAAAIGRTAEAGGFDVEALAAATAAAGNPAIPLVRALTAAVAREDPEAARWVHWGATSQDVIDTAGALQLRRALELIGESLDETIAVLREWAKRHRDVPMAGRTLLQHALPTSFGLKAASWLAPLQRGRRRIRDLARTLPVQLGGAVGTRAAFEGRGAAVARAMAAALGLADARPWHTDRTPVVEVGAALAMLVGSLGRLAGDLLLMSQTEVGELRESAPGGGSSTLPHKRNPVALVAVAAAALRMPGHVANLFASLVQEHERAAGAWHAEWLTVREVCETAGAAAEQCAVAVSRIEVDPGRLRAGLDLTRGRLMAEAVALRLAPGLGRDEAHERVREASERAERDGTGFREALAADPAVAAARLDLDALLEPASYLGDAGPLIDEILAEGEGS